MIDCDVGESMLLIAQHMGNIVKHIRNKPFLLAKVNDSAILMKEVAISLRSEIDI